MSHLGQRIRHARTARGLNPQELARHLGYSERGANKGARRILQVEQQGLEHPDFVRTVAGELGLDVTDLQRLADEDERARREAWERWADQPIRPRLIVRYGPHWFLHIARDLPEDTRTLDQAEQYAGQYLRERSNELGRPITGTLVWSRRLHVILDAEGEVVGRQEQTYERQVMLAHGRVSGKAFLLAT